MVQAFERYIAKVVESKKEYFETDAASIPSGINVRFIGSIRLSTLLRKATKERKVKLRNREKSEIATLRKASAHGYR